MRKKTKKKKSKSIAVGEFDSPLEKKFFTEATKQGLILIHHYKFSGYELDFLYEENGKKFAIEVDGSRYHATKSAMTYDYRRQRFLELNGFKVIRFTGQEVYHSVEQCIVEFKKLKDFYLGN